MRKILGIFSVILDLIIIAGYGLGCVIISIIPVKRLRLKVGNSISSYLSKLDSLVDNLLK